MSQAHPSVTVVVPVLNDSQALAALLPLLAAQLGEADELIVVDGGSSDDSLTVARGYTDLAFSADPSRARQMNAGAARAKGQWLWFVHADSRPPDNALAQIRALPDAVQWGRFDVRLDGQRPLFQLIGALINLRSRLTGIATGDQGLFVRRDGFQALGGYPDQPLMEDIELCRRLRQQRPRCLRPPLLTSSRRWQQHGAWRTIWLMWSLRYRYWRGASAEQLHREYYRESP